VIDELIQYLSNWRNRETVIELLVVHTRLALLPLLLGLVAALPLGWLGHRYRLLRGALLGSANVFYTIPSAPRSWTRPMSWSRSRSTPRRC
jgi:osmoprotectant transport system permease protein